MDAAEAISFHRVWRFFGNVDGKKELNVTVGSEYHLVVFGLVV